MSGIGHSEDDLSRPLLIHRFDQLSKANFIHLEFESNPLNTKSDYRILAQTQPLQINYHAVCIISSTLLNLY